MIYYQPIYDTQTQTFRSAEALLRLKDDELGFISPDEFIPMAEQNGLIIDIGDIVFRNVCCFLQKNNLEHLGVEYIEVNLSTVQCIQDNLSHRLIDIMKEYQIRPDQINFEITETAGSENEDMLLHNMNNLIATGSSFSMDDYGTGFSTANYLINLPMHIVKIDKSILWSAMKDTEALIVLQHTVAMLKALHKKIVVEGVETQEMADILIDMHCDYLQGYLYSKPIPAKEYIAFLEARLQA
jgi:EAL domain-containing protein (putative c-di-GMP-specific phosphodiesterase class I)